MFDRFRSRNNALSDESIQWVIRLGARPSAADRLAFEHWCQRSPAHAEAARQAFALLDGVGHTTLATEHRHWVQALTPAPRRMSRRAVLAGGLSAAALAGVVGTGLLGPVSGVLADHRTRIGQRRQASLGDGSTAWLNTESAFSQTFSNVRRTVSVAAGELLFDVAPDPQRPFVIESRDGSVHCSVGRFALHREARRSTLTVVSGLAQLRNQAGASIEMIANQRVAFSADVLGQAENVDAGALTAWVRGKLIFNQQPVSAIADELQRHVPGRIVVAGEALQQLQLTGVFELDDIDAALRNIAALAGAEVTRLPLLTLIR